MKLRKWKFVPCLSPSDARLKLSQHVHYYTDTKFRLTIIDNCYGFEYK